MSYTTILTETHGRVGLVTLNRPEAMNALNPTILSELMAALEGPPNTLDAPLTFENGFISFGPIPLGPAPRIVIR